MTRIAGMKPIQHDVPELGQRPAECMQTAATSLLRAVGLDITIDEVLTQVPVYVDEKGEKIGTSPGHLASYLALQNLSPTVYSFDTELFDRSWDSLASTQVVSSLKDRLPNIPDHSWLSKYAHILVDGWELFVNSGGKFRFVPLSNDLVMRELSKSPLYVMLNSTYLNGVSRQRYDVDKGRFVEDSSAGRSLTHSVVVSGFDGSDYIVVDPDPPAGEKVTRKVAPDHLLCSIMAAQTESDNLFISFG